MDVIKPQIAEVRQNEALLRDGATWLHFGNPYRLVRADRLEDVRQALREVEELIRDRHWYAAGFLSYESAPAFDPALRTRVQGDSPPGASDFPCLWFALYPDPQPVALPAPGPPAPTLHWRSTTDRASYDAAIARIKDYIAHGRTYQVNYTLRLRACFSGDPWEFFLQLVRQQNRHAAYIQTDRFAICSASPELFFEQEGSMITCRPMKGTARRGRTTAEDRAQSEWLKGSEKDRAENVMIVDMIRNDLGRIAATGSVTVPRLFDTERYPTLWQMTSTVRAESRASLTEIFTALFPCASITGAPKVSTMSIIAELEDTPRKIYTGTIGYISPERRAKFNVAIRTALIDRGRQQVEYGVGGGVVWDSSSAGEYEEALLKARLVLQEPRPFSLLETMLWTPQGGFFLGQKHVARLLDSAAYFDIPMTGEILEGYLAQVSARFRTAQRVRLLLDRAGRLSSEAGAFDPGQAAQALRAGLADRPIDSGDVFLFHKTTRREVYDAACRGREGLDDVLLYNEAGELTEFTIGNLVVELDGLLVTPPVACGLLAGTFRGHLLETSQVAETVIPRSELPRCTRIFRVNSIRGWQRVDLLEAGAGVRA